MKISKTNKFINVTIERGVDGSYSAYIADDNCDFGCIGVGENVEATKSDSMDAVEEMQEVYLENGAEFTTFDLGFN